MRQKWEGVPVGEGGGRREALSVLMNGVPFPLKCPQMRVGGAKPKPRVHSPWPRVEWGF